MMDPSCSHPNCDESIGATKISFDSSTESKTDSLASATGDESIRDSPTEQNHVNQEQIDDIEREDFEEENRLIKHCSGMIVDAQKLTSSLGNLSSANSSLTSSSETISSLNNQPESDQPSCSSWQTPGDSNATIKSMIHSIKLSFTGEPHSSNVIVHSNGKSRTPSKSTSAKSVNDKVDETVQTDDMSTKSVERSDRINDTIAAAALIDMKIMVNVGTNSRSSSSAWSIASANSDNIKDSTASASKTLCQDESAHFKLPVETSGKSRTRPFGQDYCSADEDTDDEESCCTCQSAYKEEEDLQIHDSGKGRGVSEETVKFWRKRKCEQAEYTGTSPTKKYCADGSPGPSMENSWLQGSGINTAAISPQGPSELGQWLNRFNTWSNIERIQAIDALISQSAASQVRHMMNAIEPLFQRDFISLLPKELALTVLGYLKPRDLLRAAQTCRYWRLLADDNLLWKEQCLRVGITNVRKRTRSMPQLANDWKSEYMRQHIVESNWVTRPVNEPIVMKGHDDHVITCLQFYGNKILSGSDDNTLKIWSARTGRCLRTLIGHTGGVWSSQMVGNLVISGSTDRTLRVWDARTGLCQKVLTGHTSTVRCMHLYNDTVVSGSRDATLRVWSIPQGRCVRVLVGHMAAVRCVQFDGKIVVSGAYDNFIKIWNPSTGKCLHTLVGHTNRVYSLQFDGKHVVSGSLDTSICVWDVESGQLKHTLYGHQSLTSGMELHSNILVSGNADSTVKVWDINTGHCLHTLSGPNKHMSAVTCLQSTKRFVITSSDDGTVKLWDVRTGEFIRNLVVLESGGSGGVVWRIRASSTKLICAVGSRNGAEETKLLVLNFDLPNRCRHCNQ